MHQLSTQCLVLVTSIYIYIYKQRLGKVHQLSTQCLVLVTSIYIYIYKQRLGKVHQLSTQCLVLVTSIYIYISKGLARCVSSPHKALYFFLVEDI